MGGHGSQDYINDLQKVRIDYELLKGTNDLRLRLGFSREQPVRLLGARNTSIQLLF